MIEIIFHAFASMSMLIVLFYIALTVKDFLNDN